MAQYALDFDLVERLILGGVSNRLMRNCKALSFTIVKLQIN